MTQGEQDRITGERLRLLMEKRKRLNCYESKARELAEDMEAVAKIISSHRGGHYSSQDDQDRRSLWSDKLGGGTQAGDISWPDWEELCKFFREIEHLKAEIKRLVDELKPFGVELES